MRLPADSPPWVASFFDALEERASEMLEKAKTADEALRAAGAHSLLRFAGAELESLVAQQEDAARVQIDKLNARG